MDTKTKILDGALGLFNGKGAVAVSTNHIAEAAGISPGNLYYHFRNKEQIVRALFERIAVEWAGLYALPNDRSPAVSDMEAMLAGNFEIQWRYRFFFREITSLLQADPELLVLYRQTRERGFHGFRQLLEAFVAAGILAAPDDAQAEDDLMQMLWLIGDFWLVYRDVGGEEMGPELMDQGVRLFRRTLAPFMRGTGT